MIDSPINLPLFNRGPKPNVCNQSSAEGKNCGCHGRCVWHVCVVACVGVCVCVVCVVCCFFVCVCLCVCVMSLCVCMGFCVCVCGGECLCVYLHVVFRVSVLNQCCEFNLYSLGVCVCVCVCV